MFTLNRLCISLRIILIAAVCITLFVTVSPSGVWGDGDGLTVTHRQDTVYWEGVDPAHRPPVTTNGFDEGFAQRVGLPGPVLAYGGTRKNAAMTVYDAHGRIVSVIDRSAVKGAPELVYESLQAATVQNIQYDAYGRTTAYTEQVNSLPVPGTTFDTTTTVKRSSVNYDSDHRTRTYNETRSTSLSANDQFDVTPTNRANTQPVFPAAGDTLDVSTTATRQHLAYNAAGPNGPASSYGISYDDRGRISNRDFSPYQTAPQGWRPQSAAILQQGLPNEVLKELAAALVKRLASGASPESMFEPIVTSRGVFMIERIHIRIVLDEEEKVYPDDPLYYYSGRKKKKAFLSLGVGSGKLSLGGSRAEKGSDGQWGLRAVGFLPLPDEHSAWHIESGRDPNVTVAVIDSGLDMTHPDGPEYLWTHSGEIPLNGIDDDGNGFVDDVHGWNFVSDNADLTDERGHGTFTAGIIAAKTGNGEGVAGINPGARIMVLKAADKKGTASSLAIWRALVYASDHGARVINVSLGSGGISQLEQLGINYARAKGAVVIIAAGNEGRDLAPVGPAAARRALTVGALNREGGRSLISNWGANLALIAPGEDIYSLYSKDSDWKGPSGTRQKNRLYYASSGTSFSVPIVAGTASLLYAHNPALSAVEVEDILVATASDLEVPGWDSQTGAGLLDAHAALTLASNPPLVLRLTQLEVHRDKDDKIEAVDVRAIVRGGSLDRFVLEAGIGKKPKKWTAISSGGSKVIDCSLVGRVDREAVGWRGQHWSIRLTAYDPSGETRTARVVIPLKEKP